MKSNTFNYSLLAVGVAAVLGISTSAVAVDSALSTTSVEILNVATADYKVADIDQPKVTSNSVKITVSEQISFSLIADNVKTVTPNGFVGFQHTLTNTGNRSDIYTVSLQNLTGDDAQYDLANSTVAYKIYNAGVTPDANGSNNAGTGTIPANVTTGGTITLAKGQFAIIDITAKTNANKGGFRQDLQITATSAVIPATTTTTATPGKTLTNTDKSTTTLPTFSIIKTVTNPLDLNNANDIATYQIVIKNPRVTNANNVDYSAAATNIVIEDVLPTGLVVATPALTVTPTAGSTTGTLTQTTTGFTLTNASLAIDGTITVILNVKKGTGTLATGALNHVKVTDDLDDNAATTDNILIDSTDSAVENVGNFYVDNDIDLVNGTVAPGTNGNDSTQPFVTVDRQLTLTQVTNREIAPTTGTTSTTNGGQVTHQTIITNNGVAIEGDTAGELTFTITDNDAGTLDAINIVSGTVKIAYTAPGSTTADTAVAITPTNGVYDIFTALPAGIPNGGKVTISYNVSSNQAPLFTPANGTTSTTEDTVVTLIPVGEGAPTVNPIITDTTTVKGLTLVKAQALDSDCDGTIDSGTSFSSSATALPAAPGQCVIYQITANNTSSATPTGLGFNITNLLIADAKSQFSAAADYVATTGKIQVGAAAETEATDGTPTGTNAVPSIYANVATLTAGQNAVLKFRVKIKTNR